MTTAERLAELAKRDRYLADILARPRQLTPEPERPAPPLPLTQGAMFDLEPAPCTHPGPRASQSRLDGGIDELCRECGEGIPK